MRLNRTALTALVAACAITSVAAQSGGLRVRVTDANDNTPLPGAVVVLSHETQNVAATTQPTDKDGVALFPVLRPGGGYIVEVAFPGYAKTRIPEVRVKISETVEYPVVLSEEITEKVSVVARKEVVDLEKNEVSTRFSEAFISDLPVQGRFYQNVLTLAPGVQDEDGDGNPNVHGARDRDFKTVVGGVSNVDPLTGQFLNYVNPDSIEEIEVITAGAGVEHGRAQGGFANIIQKQGTNDFEGLFSFLFRTSKLDGNGATNLSGKRLPKFDSIQPAAQISGPIIKDKLWYVLSHEYHKDEIPVNTIGQVAVTTRTQPISSDRLTWQVSPRNKLSFQYDFDPITLTNLGVSSRVPASASRREEVGGPVYRMEWTAPYSPKLLVDSVVAYQDSHSNRLPSEDGVPNACLRDSPSVVTSAQCFSFEDGLLSGSYPQTWRDNRQRLTVNTQAELYGGKFWGMNHQFKFGFTVENERYFRRLERRLFSTFEWSDRRDQGGGGVERTGLFTVQAFVPRLTESNAAGTTWGVFAEDQLKPLNNLTITVAARLDREYLHSRGVSRFDPEAESRRFLELRAAGISAQQAAPEAFTAYEGLGTFAQQLADALGNVVSPDFINTYFTSIAQQSSFYRKTRRLDDIDISNTNISPFLGVSWDPWSDSKTKFGFTMGRYYDKIFLLVPVQELDPASIFFTLFTDPQGVIPPNLFREGGINPGINVNAVDRNIRTPYQDEWTFTFERELSQEMLFKATYVRRKFRDQLQDLDLNHVPGDYGRCIPQLVAGAPTVEPMPDGGVNGLGGDGFLDDCIGRSHFISDDEYVQRPDGFLDSYIQNPAWGGVFLIGNFNSSDYKGATFEIQRRLYRSWEMNGSYTWSKATGDAEDFNQVLGDDRALLDDERGFLSHDQRHVVKVNATTVTPWGFRLGSSVIWQSGLPYSILRQRLSWDAIPPLYLGLGAPDEPRPRQRYITGQRNDQRNQSYWMFNVKLSKEMNLKGGKNLQLSAEVFNLLNEDPLRVFDVTNGFIDGIRDFGRRYQMGMRLAF